MKSTQYLISYIFTLIIGLLLLIYWQQTDIFRIIVIVIGCCFIIPSLAGLFMGFAGKKQADGSRTSRPWYVGTSAIAGLVGGVLLVAIPDFFVHYLIYTFGIILVFAGIMQILYLSAVGRDIGGMPPGWYVMPWLIVATGLAVIIIGPATLAKAATIITGIALVLYSLNGLLSASAHKLTSHRLTKANAKAAAAAEIEAQAEAAKSEEDEGSDSEAAEASEAKEEKNPE